MPIRFLPSFPRYSACETEEGGVSRCRARLANVVSSRLELEAYVATWLVEHGGHRRVKFGNADGESDFVRVAPAGAVR